MPMLALPTFIFLCLTIAHFLLQGDHDLSNSREAIIRFKQKSGFWFTKNASDFEWQKDFYDHILRGDETLNKHITYILHNPVRKGIIEDWKSYSYKGSTLYDFNTWDGYN